jgi:subtilisin family serine protease
MKNCYFPRFHFINGFLCFICFLLIINAGADFSQDKTGLKWHVISIEGDSKDWDIKLLPSAPAFHDNHHAVLRLKDTEVLSLRKSGIDVQEIFNLDAIRLNGTIIDTTNKTGSITKSESLVSERLKSQTASDGRRQMIVQFWGPPRDGWVESLVSAGADLVVPVPPYSWIILANSGAEKAISGLSFVRWIGEAHPEHRIDSSIYRELDPETEKYVESDFLPDKRDRKEKAQCQIRLLGRFFPNKSDTLKWLENQNIKTDKIHIWGDNWLVYANLKAKDVERLSCRPEVLNISLDMKPVSMDERSCQIVADNMVLDEPFPGYKDWLSDIGLDGSGVAVGVIDTRCQEAAYHFGSRLKSICGIDGDYDSTPLGEHGTHVCGIVGGGETCAYMGDDFCLGLGVAPQSKILNIWGMVEDDICGIMDCHTRYLTEPAPGGMMCVISNNSWTFEVYEFPHSYNATDAGWDEISFDYDMDSGNGRNTTIIVFASGNGGLAGIGTPQGAKNPIIVGASGLWNPNEIADFSSWALMSDGRRRPDVVAPGISVCSAYPCEGHECDNVWNNHDYNSGTSMAAPHVSGALALFTQWWQQKKGHPPGMALCRAALIASADDMVGGIIWGLFLGIPKATPLTHRPDFFQGWGRLNIKRLLEEREDHIFVDSEITLTNAGQEYHYLFYPRHTDRELRVALCWTDPAGADGANPALVNNLDLTVTAGEHTYIGNKFLSGFTPNDADAPHDMIDNVECVFIEYPSSGIEYKVHVKATSLIGDGDPDNPDLTDQTFALVILNGDAVGDPAGRVRFTRSSYDECHTTIGFYVMDDNPSLPVTVQVESDSGDFEDVELSPGDEDRHDGTIETESGDPDPGDGVLQIGNENKSELVVRYQDDDDGYGSPFEATHKTYMDCDDPLYTDPHIEEIHARSVKVSFSNEKPCWAINMLMNPDEPLNKRIQFITGGFAQEHSAIFKHLKSETFYIDHIISLDYSGNWLMDEEGGPLSFTTGANEPIVINEIQMGADSGFEITNKGTRTQDLTGWQWQWTSTDGTEGRWMFPEVELEAEATLEVRSEGGASEEGMLRAGVQTNWKPTEGGSTALINEHTMGVDFARWSSFDGLKASTQQPPAGTSWFEGIASSKKAGGAILANSDVNMTIGRNMNSDDTDSSEDWDNTGGGDSDNSSMGDKNEPFRIEGFALQGPLVGESRSDIGHGVIIDVPTTFTLKRFGLLCESSEDNKVVFSVWRKEEGEKWRRLCLRSRDFSTTRTGILLSPKFDWAIAPGETAFMVHFNSPTRRHGVLWSIALPSLSFGTVLSPCVETGVGNTFYGPVSHGDLQVLPGSPPLLPAMVFITPGVPATLPPALSETIFVDLPESPEKPGPNIKALELIVPRIMFRSSERNALVSLKNDGDELTTETKLLVALSKERRAGSYIKLISQHAIPSLSPDETQNMKITFTIPEDAPIGLQWMIAYADFGNKIKESDETDNLTAEAVVILPGKGEDRIDISEIIKQILGISPPSPENDTTGDGNVDISDVIWGINYR